MAILQDQQLRELVDRFVGELTILVQQGTLDRLREALGATEVAKRGPGRPRKSPGARRVSAPRKRAGRGGGRRSQEDVAALGQGVLAHVQANPGQRLEEIGRDMGLPTKELKRPIANLLGAKSLRTEGQKRGTRYFAGGRGGAGKARGKPKSTKRKTTKKRKAARQAA